MDTDQKLSKIFKTIWQGPQNIIGYLLTRKVTLIKNIKANDGEDLKIYFTHNVFGAGVSLGKYIILDYSNYHNATSAFLSETANHEHGHQKQSAKFGIFYLLIIGIPSAFGNIIDRIFHKKWSLDKRIEWYYNQPWEKQADKLGGVVR